MSSSGYFYELAPGVLLSDRYEITQRIHNSGGVLVYMAKDVYRPHGPVVVKEIRMQSLFYTSMPPLTFQEDLIREAEQFAELYHPSIPTLHNYFFDADRGNFYLAMEYIDGDDLATRQRLSGGRVDELAVTKWAIDICDALDHLHSKEPPFVHRNLMVNNLMIAKRTNRVMLVGFGTRCCLNQRYKLPVAQTVIEYWTPEGFTGDFETPSDIYRLGAIMFHLLTGDDPKDNPMLIFDFTKNPKPRQINPAITPEMEEMICKAVESKPENRFASARVFGQRLEEHLNNLRK